MQELMQMGSETRDMKRKQNAYGRTVQDALSKTVCAVFHTLSVKEASEISKSLCLWSRGKQLGDCTISEMRLFIQESSRRLEIIARLHCNYVRWTRTYFSLLINSWADTARANKLKRDQARDAETLTIGSYSFTLNSDNAVIMKRK
jgi:hypothetical protein